MRKATPITFPSSFDEFERAAFAVPPGRQHVVHDQDALPACDTASLWISSASVPYSSW